MPDFNRAQRVVLVATGMTLFLGLVFVVVPFNFHAWGPCPGEPQDSAVVETCMQAFRDTSVVGFGKGMLKWGFIVGALLVAALRGRERSDPGVNRKVSRSA